MNFFKFLKDKIYIFISFLLVCFILLLIFLGFHIYSSLIIVVFIILFLFLIFILLFEYFKKRSFYTNLLSNIELLDKSYLVLETILKPDFYEGELFYLALYQINKSMNEEVKSLNLQMIDFKDYIEMWIHEVKIPIASLVLRAHNHKDKFDKVTVEQLKRIEDYVEQVLYYVRSENAAEDYLINKVHLSKVISNIALRNKDDLLEEKIDFKVLNVDYEVLTDSKWLEFIINQIVNNSIKYKRTTKDSYIKIYVDDYLDKTVLVIEDNGIGIPSDDLSKVFNKSFTGHNGRVVKKSTGMGLNICKNLCFKLGHKIEVESEVSKYTRVFITFFKNNFYDEVR